MGLVKPLTDAKAFETEEGEKQRCRDLIVVAANKLKLTTPHIFTLPSRKHLCYNTFKEAWPSSSVTCIERDAEISAELNKKGILCCTTTTTEFISTIPDWYPKFDIMFLDYYSFFGKQVAEDIELVFKKGLLSKTGVLAVTLSKGIRVGKDTALDILKENYYEWEQVDYTIHTVGSWLLGLISEYDYTRVDNTALEYKASDNSTPMFFLLFGFKQRGTI